MLDPLGHDDELAGIQIDVAGSEPHRQATADHQEQFVLMLVVVPVELAGEFRELHEGVIEFARDLRAPVIAEATERLAKIDFVHVGSLDYSVHESVRVPIRFIARSNTAFSSSERAMTIAPWMASPRLEERRVGHECGSTCRSRGSPEH